MPTPNSDLPALFRRLLSGDETAARELVERYSYAIRKVIRHHLDRRVRPVLDSVDLTQAVWASFFCRELYTQLDDPEALHDLLCGLACNKARAASRNLGAARRDRDREVPWDHSSVDPERDFTDRRPGPEETVANSDLWEQIDGDLADRDRAVLDLLRQGHDMRAVSRQLGLSVRTVSRVVQRAFQRAGRPLPVPPSHRAGHFPGDPVVWVVQQQ